MCHSNAAVKQVLKHFMFHEMSLLQIWTLKVFAACSVLGTVCMDGCPGPTAARRWGTDSPSLWGTLPLLCLTHWTIDVELRHVRYTGTAQVSTDLRRARWTRYLTSLVLSTRTKMAMRGTTSFSPWVYGHSYILTLLSASATQWKCCSISSRPASGAVTLTRHVMVCKHRNEICSLKTDLYALLWCIHDNILCVYSHAK